MFHGLNVIEVVIVDNNTNTMLILISLYFILYISIGIYGRCMCKRKQIVSPIDSNGVIKSCYTETRTHGTPSTQMFLFLLIGFS